MSQAYLPLWIIFDGSPDIAYKEIVLRRSNVRFLIGKRTLGMVPVNDCFWPIPAAWRSEGLKSGLGQLRTPATYPCYVRSWVTSGRSEEVVGTSVPSH